MSLPSPLTGRTTGYKPPIRKASTEVTKRRQVPPKPAMPSSSITLPKSPVTAQSADAGLFNAVKECMGHCFGWMNKSPKLDTTREAGQVVTEPYTSPARLETPSGNTAFIKPTQVGHTTGITRESQIEFAEMLKASLPK